MRQLGKHAHPDQAAAFAEFLIAQGILVERKPSGEQWAIWVRNEDDFDRAQAEWEKFQAEPENERYYQHGAAAQEVLQAREEKKQAALRNMIDGRRLWNKPAIDRQPLTLILIAACVIVGFWSRLGSFDPRVGYYPPIGYLALFDPAHFQPGFNNIFIDVQAGQVWRLVTPIFIHFGFIHLLFNMSYLYSFGCLVEEKRGTWFLALLVVVSAIASNLGEMYMANRPVLVGGFSGVVYALFGYIWIKSLYDRDWMGYLDGWTVAIMIGWIVLGLGGGADFFMGNVAHWAHAIGMLVGMGFAYVPMIFVRPTQQ